MWPPAEVPNFVVYRLQAPGKYTRKILKTYESLEAYKTTLLVAESVATFYYHKITVEFCVLKVAVRLSQRLCEKPDHQWVCVRLKDGS